MAALDQIRAELSARITAVGLRTATARCDELVAAIDDIRRIARANNLRPAVTVAHAVEEALARGERGALVAGWLAILGDAVHIEANDGATCDLYASACSVRYAH